MVLNAFRGKTVVFLLVALLFVSARTASAAVAEGDSAPQLTLFSMDGEYTNTYRFKNSKVLILSFFLVPCPPCEREIPKIQRMQNENQDLKAILVSDITTDAEKARGFLKKISDNSNINITMKVVIDTYGDAMRKFKVNAYPTTFLIDKEGKIVMRIEGDNASKYRQLERTVRSLMGK